MEDSPLASDSEPDSGDLLRSRLRALAHTAVTKTGSFIRDYGKLTLAVLLAVILGWFGIPPVTSLINRAGALEFQRTEAKEQYLAALSQKDRIIQDVAESANSPNLLSPTASVTLHPGPIELRWKTGGEDYQIAFARVGADVRMEERKQQAADPDNGTHQIIIRDPGTYVWRVAAAKGNWSGYSYFIVAPQTNSQPQDLQVGVNFAQQSPFMTRNVMANDAGDPYCGFDFALVTWIANQLKPKRQLKWHEYATVPKLLQAVRDNEVDMAVGSLTRTREREDAGNAFTDGYMSAAPVLACKRFDPACAADATAAFAHLRDDEVAVITPTTNEAAADELKTRYKFIKRSMLTFQSLNSALVSGRVHFIIVDRPFIESRCDTNDADALRCFSLPRSRLKKYMLKLGRPREEYAIAVDDARVRAQINKQIKEAKKTGKLLEWQRKYLSNSTACSQDRPP